MELVRLDRVENYRHSSSAQNKVAFGAEANCAALVWVQKPEAEELGRLAVGL